uniref:Retroviral polymerase SH3-like domain-containing protein n=1 Tax=Phytophthora ramorum TaxID=164328 RepID=H3GIX8_PHYRM
MYQAGLPRSFWSEALKNAGYIKNRVYNKGTEGIPYEMMFGVKPDVHHIWKFGSLAYVHVPVTPGRRKYHDNAKLGYVLGYTEDAVGCKVFFPDERTAKFVPDLRVAEDVVYRDWYEVLPEDVDLESLHFKPVSAVSRDGIGEEGSSEGTGTLELNSSQSEVNQIEDTVAASVLDETMYLQDMELKGGDACAANEHDSCRNNVDGRESGLSCRDRSGETTADIGGVTVAMPTELPEDGAVMENRSNASDEHVSVDPSAEESNDQAGSLRMSLLQLSADLLFHHVQDGQR